jgi:hypothetical protein
MNFKEFLQMTEGGGGSGPQASLMGQGTPSMRPGASPAKPAKDFPRPRSEMSPPAPGQEPGWKPGHSPFAAGVGNYEPQPWPGAGWMGAGKWEPTKPSTAKGSIGPSGPQKLTPMQPGQAGQAKGAPQIQQPERPKQMDPLKRPTL